jgi:hypothetical protein
MAIAYKHLSDRCRRPPATAGVPVDLDAFIASATPTGACPESATAMRRDLTTIAPP